MKGTALVFLFTLWIFQLHSQSMADSVIRMYTGEHDSIRAKKFIEIASTIQNKDYTNCLKLCDEAIRTSYKIHDTGLRAEAHFLKGLTNYFAGEYEATLQFYLLAIKQFDSIHNNSGKAKVYNELGIFYRKQKNDTASLNSFREAYQLAKADNNEAIMGTAINNQGISAQDKGNHPLALDLFEQARNIYGKQHDSIGISYTLDYASVSHAAQGLYALAMQQQTNALEIRLRHKDSNAAALSLINLAEFSILQKKNSDAEQYLFQCLDITEKIRYKELTSYAYLKLAEVYSNSGNFQKAYDFQAKYSKLNDEIFNEKRSKQINELQTKYETEKRIQQISLLTKENELKEIRNRNQRNILLSIIAIVLIASLAYYHFYKRKKERENDQAIIKEKELRSKSIIEAEEKERIRIARDLHDGVAQTMTAAKMQLEHFIDENENQHHLPSSIKNAFDLVSDAAKEVRSVSHSMIPNALLKSGLVAAVRDFVNRMGTEKLKMNLVVLGLNERLAENTESIIFRVLQELVNNIIKHALASEITIQLIREDALITLMVEDNGVGFDTSSPSFREGMGLKNITSRIEYLNGNAHFDSSPGNGTTVIIEIPV